MGLKIKLGVLASGSGTDLQSIIDSSNKGLIDAEVIVVISDNKDAFALKRANKHNIKSYYVNPNGIKKENHEEKIHKILKNNNVDLVVGAGYMRLFSKSFIKKWYGKIINIHPALLPSFKGINGQGDALDYGVKISGCTTHFMDHEMDHGPIIIQAAVKVKNNDDRDKLADRILEVEHQILPRTIQLFAEGRLKITGRRVKILKGDSWEEKFKKIPDTLYSDGY